jgi:hypothetical protein
MRHFRYPQTIAEDEVTDRQHYPLDPVTADHQRQLARIALIFSRNPHTAAKRSLVAVRDRDAQPVVRVGKRQLTGQARAFAVLAAWVSSSSRKTSSLLEKFE